MIFVFAADKGEWRVQRFIASLFESDIRTMQAGIDE